jgi:PAS domain S-box-containing protein
MPGDTRVARIASDSSTSGGALAIGTPAAAGTAAADSAAAHEAATDSTGPLSAATTDGRLLDAIADASVEGILVVSLERRIVFSNRRFAELWGIAETVLATHDDGAALAAIHGLVADPGRFLERVEHLYGHPEEDSRDEVRLKDGRCLDRHSAPVRGADGQVVARAWFFRDVTAEKAREETSAFLAEASRLLAGSLDLEATAGRLARVAIGRLADWCAVDLLGDDGAFHRRGVAHVDPARESILWELDRRYPLEPNVGHLRGRVAATGEPLSLLEIDDPYLAEVARDGEHLELLRALGVASAIWVPLLAGDRTVGVISFGRMSPVRPFGDDDVQLAEEVGRRAGLGLDNALAYRRVREQQRQGAEVARLGQAALAGIELGDLFDDACATAAATLAVDFAKVLELQPGGRTVKLVAGVGWQDGLVGRAVVPASRRSQAGYTLRTHKPVIVDDLSTDRRFNGPVLLRDHGVVSGVSVIIEGATGHWGVLGVHTRRPRRFTEDEVSFVQSIANVLAQAVQRRRDEQAVLDRDQRLELAMAASRTGIWEWDVATGALAWSREICALHGVAPDEAPPDFDDYLTRLVHPDDRERLRTTAETAVRDGSQFDLEFRVVTPDGLVRWTNGVARVFVDDAGNPARMIGIGRDITDRRRAEEERDRLLAAERKAHEIRETFIGVLSHELRTPITTIYGGVKVLARGRRSIDEEREILRDVEAESDRLHRLVEDLLVLARAERGSLEPEVDPIRLGNVVERIVAAEQARSAVRFALESAPGMPLVRGDETYIEQVLRNLLGNAAKYAPPGSTVEVSLAPVDDAVEVRVRDHGPGLPGDVTDRVFELFYRSPELARNVAGAGIGLFVSRSLVEAMGGRIWALNRPEGGAEFGFSVGLYED